MICKKCQIAGDLVAEARTMDLRADLLTSASCEITIGDTIRSVAHLFHGLCKGSTHCDCQHKVDFEGKVINGETARQPVSQDR